MKVLFLEGRRNGYSIEQCGETFAVSELIDFLSEFDKDTPIYLSNDRGYTFGNIDDLSFELEEIEGGMEEWKFIKLLMKILYAQGI